MESTVLHDFHVTNFRAFEDLTIEKLGRVNLIVGRNNVGKTCLLEAIRVYLSGLSPEVVVRILHERGELDPRYPDKDDKLPVASYLAIFGRLFNTAQAVDTGGGARFVMESRSTPRLAGLLGWRVDRYIGPDDPASVQRPRTEYQSTRPAHLGADDTVTPALLSETAQGSLNRLIGWRSPKWGADAPSPVASNLLMMRSRGFVPAEVCTLWGQVELRPKQEAAVTEAVTLLAPDLEEVRIPSAPPLPGVPASQPWARARGESEPHPLASYGEGTVRAFHLALGLVNCQGGTFLIDEVENGLHYRVQPAIWKMIFETAQKLDVQVFATTHSWDCIEAFQLAAAESDAEGALIRLDGRFEKVQAVVFDEEGLAVVARDDIEVR